MFSILHHVNFYAVLTIILCPIAGETYAHPVSQSPEFPIDSIRVAHSVVSQQPLAAKSITKETDLAKLYAQGRAYYEAKEWNNAIEVFERILILQPDNSDAELLLAYALLFRYQSKIALEESENWFKNVLKSSPDYLDAKIGLRRIEELRNPRVFDRSVLIKDVETYEEKLKSHPDDQENYYQLGRAYYYLQEFDRSIDAYKHTLELKPENVDAQLGLAYALLGQFLTRQDLIRSAAEFQKVLNQAPGYQDAADGLARVEDLLHPKIEESKQEVPLKQVVKDKSGLYVLPHLGLDRPGLGKGTDPEIIFTINIYESLVRTLPAHPQLFYELGRAYASAQDWNQAIFALRKALRLQPDNPDIQVALAYAYLHRYTTRQSLDDGKLLFEHVLKVYPKYKDASVGLSKINEILHPSGEKVKPFDELLFLEEQAKTTPENTENYYKLARAYAFSNRWDDAIEAYIHALSLDPHNIDAEVGLGYAWLNVYSSQTDLLQSRKLFETALKQSPDYHDASEGLSLIEKLIPSERKEIAAKEPAEKPQPKEPSCEEVLVKAADWLSCRGDHYGAIQIFLQLVEDHPKNADYYYKLGREYARLEFRQAAIGIFEEGLAVKPDDSDILVALGNQYLYFKDYRSSLALFLKALELSTDNTDALIGTARSLALLEYPLEAEDYYNAAIAIDPVNSDAWKPYAALLLNQRRFTDSEAAYRYLSYFKDDEQTYRRTLLDNTSYTHPSFYAKTGYGEEREKDLFTRQWVASLSYLGAEAGISYPLCDEYRLTARIRDGYTRQRLLVSGLTQFNAKLTGGGVKGEWFYNPYITIALEAGLDWVSNNERNVTLLTKRGVRFEPSFTFRYFKDPDTIFFGVITDAWIFRYFDKKQLRVITRETALLLYQHDFDDYRLFGASAAWVLYQDPVHNQGQDLNIWAQAGVPCFEDWLTARYQCEYRQFRVETTGYYSFQYQLTHWLRVRCYKEWLTGPHFELEYWHGWRTTRGRSPQQQIIISPAPLTPVVTVENQIDQVFLTIGYTPTDYCDISVVGNFYHDSFDYTVSGVRLLLDWRF